MRYSFESVALLLKQALKSQNLSYAELAERMDMSESGIKKIMSNDDVSLARLSAICDAAEIDLMVLLEGAWKATPVPFYFSDEQREFFAEHPHCHSFLIALLNSRLDVAAVQKEYDLDEHSTTLYLGKLQDLDLVHVLPSGKLRCAIPAPYRMGGAPLDVSHNNVRRFLEHTFGLEKTHRHQLAANLRMTADHYTELKNTIHEAVLRLGVAAQQDELTTPAEDLVDVGLLTVVAKCRTSEYIPIPRIDRKL